MTYHEKYALKKWGEADGSDSFAGGGKSTELLQLCDRTGKPLFTHTLWQVWYPGGF